MDFDLPFDAADNDSAYYDEEHDAVVMAEHDTQTGGDPRTWIAASTADPLYNAWIINEADENLSNNTFYFGLKDGFLDKEKWQAMSVTGISSGSSSKTNQGDLSFVITDQFALPNGESRQTNFVIAYGGSREEALDNLANGRERGKDVIVDIPDEENGGGLPAEFGLSPAYPNPFNPATKVSIILPQRGHLEVSLYNVLGQKVKLLQSKSFSAGQHKVSVDGSGLASGTYLLKATYQGKSVLMQKVTLVK